ncbi:hypothetical protein NGTWS0302_16100 [Mycolicibacterium cyprinidarum]|uniref:S-adenosyl-L-methionine-dependent methyltransferase n=1 Tax=Mycolicibacterium cyprinidarum TaxID=2860311 RepID=A0ABQ4VE11_9MYCO|nr:hypothetical protein NGTWS1702_21720 [Mycolicibacterium sp. NGTWSNA01]GJF18227.1 hypothetical protein NGTWS0302_16100 [Mycolicibacterium sp. NGTWS0302]
MKLIAYLVYLPIQIIWLPLSLLGGALVAYKQLAISKRLGVSGTAVEVVNGRWTMDVFGLRRDPAARKLAAKIPNNSTFGLWLALFPLWLARQIAGEPIIYPTLPTPDAAGIANLIPSRTVEFDSLIGANAEYAGQFVVLGAGLDTRAYGPLQDCALALFELDQEANQAHKRKYVATCGIDTTKVEFITVDFADPLWIRALTSSRYDSARKTIFLWEGVTLYLSEQAVNDTLSALKVNAAPGSVVIADFYSTRFVGIGKSKQGSKLLDITGEGMGFGLDFSNDAEGHLRRFVEAQGLTLGRHQFLGANNKNGPFSVIAELIVN